MNKLTVMSENHPPTGQTNEAQTYRISSDVVTLMETRQLEAEAIRTIRTHVMARHINEGRRGVAICAPSEGAGCTFTAVNLAVSLAQIGVSTLLVDADLRAPAVQEFIRPPGEIIGVRQYLMDGYSPLLDYVHENVLPHLSVLYAGGAHGPAQELLGGDAFKRMVESCLRDFDVTIFDSPPAVRYADARRINTLVGYGIIVARRDVTRMNEVSIVADQMHEDGVELVGTVLNEV